MWWKRSSLVVAVFLIALAAADLWAGTKIVDGRYGGLPVPPFWVPEPDEIQTLRARLAAVRDGDARTPQFRGWSRRYGWVNSPGKSRRTGDWVNSLGARGAREIDTEPRPGTARVLCFGESFTYCTEVRDGEDWPSRLEAREERLEVLNFGVGAWGTDQALLRFRELAPTLDHDVAILGLLLENLARNVNRSRALYQVGSGYSLVKPRFILADGALELVPIPYESEADYLEAALAGRLFDDLEEHEYWSRIEPFPSFSNLARIRAAKATAERRARAYQRFVRDPDCEPHRVTLALLEAFHREARELGARESLVVVFHREADHAPVGSGRKAAPYWTTLLRELTERGIPWVDTFDVVAETRRAGERGYGNTHHDARANELIAESIFEYLAERVPELR